MVGIGLAFFFLLCTAYMVFLGPRKVAEYESPHKSFRLIVYKVPMLIAGPGQGSDHTAMVELRDKKGKLIARLSDRDKEAVMVRDIEVMWESDTVWFAEARFFPLPGKNPQASGLQFTESVKNLQFLLQTPVTTL